MKFLRSSAAIAIYFLWMALLLNASEIQNNELQMRLLKNDDSTLKLRFLHSISKKILSKIFNEYLSIHEILTLRNTCTDFQILLLQNDKKMVKFCKVFSSKEMNDIPLMWFDLKYFLDQTYANALETMEMLIVKENEYAVLTRDKQIIPLYNTQALHLYSKMIFKKFENELSHLRVDYKTQHILVNKENVRILHTNCLAFVAVFENGQIRVWGDENNGGKIPVEIQIQLQSSSVKMIASTSGAFAVVMENGSAVAWGDETQGGKIPESIEIQLRTPKNVKTIVSTNFAFAALLENGSVVTWGVEQYGGKIPEKIQTQLEQKVKMIFSVNNSFIALLENKSVIVWGKKTGIEISESIQPRELQKKTCFCCLKNIFYNHLHVKMIYTNSYLTTRTSSACLALLENGNVLTWGRSNYGGQIPKPIQRQLQKNVKMIFSTDSTFAALLQNGSVLFWGNEGEIIPHDLQVQLHENVQTIFSNNYAFVALLKDGRFVAWGDKDNGGKITPEIQIQLKNVKVIFSSCSAFAALQDDGSVVTWGGANCGGVIPEEIKDKLTKNVKMIFPQKFGFRALCYNNEMIQWGF